MTNYSIHTDKPQGGAPTESAVLRAKKRIGEMKLAEAITGNKDPLSEVSQLAAAVTKADGIAKALRAKRQELHDSKLYTPEGINEALAEHKEQARVAAESVREQLNKSGATLWAEAEAASKAEPLTFGDAEQRTLQLYNDLPAEQKARVKAETVSGQHPALAAALIAAPSFAVNIDGTTRGLLTRSLESPENAAKKEAIMAKAATHKQTLNIVDAILADIAAA